MNILGEGFPPEITNQIKQRQIVYGSGYDSGFSSYRTPENLTYLNSNTAWCKLISSTYIDNIDIINNESIKSLKLDGDQLARKFILFNGVYSQGEDQRAGLDIINFDSQRTEYNPLLGLNSTYGIGGTEFGINPMMGIQSAVINHKNRGSIRTATVNIKAWNKIQFEIIDILYLRLGFSVLLEWGHSMYYDDEGILQSNPINNNLTYDFLNVNYSYKEFLDRIYKKRLETFGNYDAMFAKVTNFHWSFKQDGSYDIVLNLVSVGDVIESFKIKGNAPIFIAKNIPASDDTSNPNQPVTFESELKKYSSSSELVNYLYKCSNLLKDSKNTNQSCFLYNVSTNMDWSTYWDPNGTFISASNGLASTSATKDICIIVPPGGTLGVPPYPPPTITTTQTPSGGTSVTATTVAGSSTQTFIPGANPNQIIKNANIYDPNAGKTIILNNKEINISTPTSMAQAEAQISTKRQKTSPPSSLGPQNSYFIRLGNLLQFIEEGIMYKVTSILQTSTSENPLLNFDYNVETNLMHAPPYLMGYDPRLAMVKRSVTFPGGSHGPVIQGRPYFDQTNGGIRDFADIFDSISTAPEIGKIMNIYINFEFILNKLKELENKDTNEVLLLDFIKAILSGINSSFGGYSKLDTFIDESSNTLKIIDQNPLPSISDAISYINSYGYDIPSELAVFDLYGYKKSLNGDHTEAGFIKEFNFTTELTPEFSTMISVAATSNGNVVGENNTALSKLNKGLIDKYKKEINNGGQQQLPVTNVDDPLNILKQNYDSALADFTNYINQGFRQYIDDLYNGVYINEEINNYKDSFTIYFKLWKKFKKTENDYYSYNPELKSYKKEPQFQPGTGFIPFNLSLKTNGLSGIKLGSRFLIDTSYLPSNYPDTVDFLIKNLSHEIRDNQWITTLESYCIAKSPETYTSTSIPSEETSVFSTSGQDINVTPTYNHIQKRKIIDTFGWPIILNTNTSPFYSTSIRVDAKGRNEFKIDPNYINNNIVEFNHKGIQSRIHKKMVTSLKQVIDLIDQAGYLRYAQNIQSTIYTRDIGGSPGDLSGHSFGLSIDVNPDRFPQGQEGYSLYQKAINDPYNPNYNYAKPIQIIIDSELFNWGGNFTTTKDAHHFTVKPYNI